MYAHLVTSVMFHRPSVILNIDTYSVHLNSAIFAHSHFLTDLHKILTRELQLISNSM